MSKRTCPVCEQPIRENNVMGVCQRSNTCRREYSRRLWKRRQAGTRPADPTPTETEPPASTWTCAVCKQPATSKNAYGVCTRTKDCKAEYGRRQRQTRRGGATQDQRRQRMTSGELFNVLHGILVAIGVEAPDVHELTVRGEDIITELRTRQGLQPRGQSVAGAGSSRIEPSHVAAA